MARLIGGALACLAMATAAAAESAPSTLREAFVNRPNERLLPPTARFQSEAGEMFILDRTGGAKSVFMRFDGSPEVWVLTPSSAPRGDIVYKDDMGEPVLRLTRLGGLTLFTDDRPQGMAAGFMGPAPHLKLPSVDSVSLLLRDFTRASANASRAAQKLIAFEAEDAPLVAAPLLADAAYVVSEAFVQVANRGEHGRKQLARFSKVQFFAGKSPSADAKGQTVRITIAPRPRLGGPTLIAPHRLGPGEEIA